MASESMLTEARATVAAPAPLAGKAVRGAAALGLRQVLVHGMNLAGGVLLANLLSPGEFGVFAIVTFLLGFLLSFGDVGLGASLIRQPGEPDEADYRAVFTVQQLLVGVALAVFWPLAPAIAGAYGRPPSDAWLFRLLALALLLTSFQTIPSVRLERQLEFGKLARVEVAQALVFNALAIGLAWAGWGALSFGYALLGRALTGAVLATLVSPWRIGWRWDAERIRSHLRFGVPYQGISLVSLLKDSLNPVLIGLLLGATQVGYVNWAMMVAAYPVLVLMALQRVYLPTFSRMRDAAGDLAVVVERVVRATNMMVAPLAVLTLVLAAPATPLVFGEKWLPALPFFYLFWAANLFVPTATPLMGLLNALGHSGTAFRFALLWMAGTWAVGAPLVVRFGAVGFAVANLVVQLSNFLLYRAAQRRVSFRLLPSVLPAWIAAGTAGVAAFALVRLLPEPSLAALAAVAAAGLVVYLVSLVALDPAGAGRVRDWLRSGAWRPVSP